MSQVVGLPCSVCGNRIGSILNGCFCDACHNPIHESCRTPPAHLSFSACTACGTDLSTASRQAEGREAERQRQLATLPPPPSQMAEVDQLRFLWNVGRLIVGGAAATAVGVVLLFEGEPAGLGALGAGAVLGVIGVLACRRR